jgi:16S rRNA (guanine(966)-N(2))-methyltransferase RsmD
VIAGELRGRRLDAPPGRRTRPTADRVREALFNLLGPIPPGAEVLDLFAGSGALGIEALSRGAARTTFVESDREALRSLRRNLEALGLTDRGRIVDGDACAESAFPEGTYDLVLADPPYRHGLPAELGRRIAGALGAGGVFALEHDATGPAVPPPEGLALWKERRYGGTAVTLFKHHPEDLP